MPERSGVLFKNKKELFEKIREICAEHFSVEKESITLQTSFVNDLDADSLDLVELIMRLEEEFSKEGVEVEVSDEEAEQLTTVEAVVDFLANKLGLSD